MKIDDPVFLGLIVAVSFLFFLTRSYPWRLGVLLGASGAFLFSYAPQSRLLVVPLLAFGLLIILSAHWIARRASRLLFWALLILILLEFLILKGYLQPAATQNWNWTTVGLSYIFFRAVHILVDVSEGTLEIESLNPLELCLYLFSFLTLRAGPIQRYNDFQRQLQAIGDARLSQIDWPKFFSRLIKGYFKLIVLAPFALGLHNVFVPGAGPWCLATAAFAFLCYVYFNFSGYMDVIITIGCLFGFRLPENFDSPYRTANFLDLWNRWHITLSGSFKTYVYYPLLRVLRAMPGVGRSPVAVGVIGYFVVFFLIGLWHGNTAPFVIFGLLLGTGGAANKLWEQWRIRSARWAAERSEPSQLRVMIGRNLAGSVAIAWFAFACIAAWPAVTDIRSFVSVFYGRFAVFSAFAGLVVFLTICRLAADIIRAPAANSWQFFRQAHARQWAAPVFTGLAAALILAIKFAGQETFSTMVFYQRF